MKIQKKQIALLLLPMILGSLLYCSWYRSQESYTDEYGRYALRYSEQDSLWKRADYAAFRLLNETMRENRNIQVFWGLANHRAFDLAAALWMIFIFTGYYLSNPNREDRAAILQFGLYMSVMTLIALSLSGAKFGMDFRRWSPTLVEGLKEDALFLSRMEHITWKLKDSSTGSFPGDHGVVLLMVGSAMLYRLRSLPCRIATFFGVIFFSLPRLAGGGHWLSDILAGSMIYYALLFPVFMFAPVRGTGLRILRFPAVWLHRLFALLLRKNPEKW